MYTLVSNTGRLNVIVNYTTTSSVHLFWSISNGSEVVRYEIRWQKTSISDTVSTMITTLPDITAFTVHGLESNTNYTITVTAVTVVGSITTSIVVLTSEEEGITIAYLLHRQALYFL